MENKIKLVWTALGVCVGVAVGVWIWNNIGWKDPATQSKLIEDTSSVIVVGAKKPLKDDVVNLKQKTWLRKPQRLKYQIKPVTSKKSKKEPKEEMRNLGEFKITAYCSCEKCCEEWAKNRPLDSNGEEIVYGASGERLIAGKSVAVDPDVIPYGTTLLMNGKEYLAHDCGGSIKGKRIDIYFSNHEEAKKFGVKYYVVKTKK